MSYDKILERRIVMKKRIAIVSLAFILMTILCSCKSTLAGENENVSTQENSPYESYTAYINPSGLEGSSTKIETSKRLVYLNETDIPSPTKHSVSVDVFGTKHVAEFAKSKVWAVFSPSYVYNTPQGDKVILDSSGKVISFTSAAASSNFVDYIDQDKVLTPQESLTIATKYLVALLGKDAATEYSAELPDTSMTVVRIRFISNNTKFEGYNIDDKIIIKLDGNGNLLGYDLYNVGAYENKTIPADFNDEKIKQIIEDSLINIKSDIDLSSIRNLIILEDGRMACTTCFRLIDGNTVSEWLDVLIPLE